MVVFGRKLFCSFLKISCMVSVFLQTVSHCLSLTRIFHISVLLQNQIPDILSMRI